MDDSQHQMVEFTKRNGFEPNQGLNVSPSNFQGQKVWFKIGP